MQESGRGEFVRNSTAWKSAMTGKTNDRLAELDDHRPGFLIKPLPMTWIKRRQSWAERRFRFKAKYAVA